MKWAVRSTWRSWDQELYIPPLSRLEFAGADFTRSGEVSLQTCRLVGSDKVVQAIRRHSKPSRERYIEAFPRDVLAAMNLLDREIQAGTTPKLAP